MQDHPRFRDVKFGIIVSSLRALLLFLRKNARLNRLPDYIIVEGPLAGGHLGFGMDWAQYDLKPSSTEIHRVPAQEGLNIPVIPAGGIFTGTDAVGFLEAGAAAVQVATRFTVTRECGLPDKVKQEYFKANEDDIEVNPISPTGYPMRMLKSSPAIGAGIRPNCEAYGYLLDGSGNCAYIEAYNRELDKHPDGRTFRSWTRPACARTCATSIAGPAATIPTGSRTPRAACPMAPISCWIAEHVFRDYLYSTDHQIALPPEPSSA